MPDPKTPLKIRPQTRSRAKQPPPAAPVLAAKIPTQPTQPLQPTQTLPEVHVPPRTRKTLKRKASDEVVSESECKGNLWTAQVSCRLRPVSADCPRFLRVVNETEIEVVDVGEPTDRKGNSHLFRFGGKVFEEQTSQEEFYNTAVLPTVENLFDTDDACALILAYGASNSGKTYSTKGTKEQPGIVTRAINTIFGRIEDRHFPLDVKSSKWGTVEVVGKDENSVKRPRVVYALFLTFAEIYCEQVYDLLRADGGLDKTNTSQRPDFDFSLLSREESNDPKRIISQLKKDGAGRMYLEGQSEIRVHDMETARRMVENVRRTVNATNVNEESSRSHLFSVLKVVKMTRDKDGQVNADRISVSRLAVVDLAGAERIYQSGVEGRGHLETKDINKSLHTLSMCVEALKYNQKRPTKRRVVPWRESKLTQLLQPYFEHGQARFMVHVNPDASQAKVTSKVLRFAQTAGALHVVPLKGKSQSHPSSDDDTPTAEEISVLKSEIKVLEDALEKAYGTIDDQGWLIKQKFQSEMDKALKEMEVVYKERVEKADRDQEEMRAKCIQMLEERDGDYAEALGEIDRLNKTIAQLQMELDTSRTMAGGGNTAELEKLREEYQKMCAEVKRLSDPLAEARSVTDERARRTGHSSPEFERLREEKDTVCAQLELLKKELAEAKRADEERRHLEACLEEVRRQLETHKTEKLAMGREVEGLRAELLALKRVTDVEQQEELREGKNQLERLGKANDDLCGEVAALKAALENSGKLNAEISQEADANRYDKVALEEAMKELELLRSKNQTVLGEVEMLKTALADEREANSERSAQWDAENQREQTARQEAANDLERLRRSNEELVRELAMLKVALAEQHQRHDDPRRISDGTGNAQIPVQGDVDEVSGVALSLTDAVASAAQCTDEAGHELGNNPDASPEVPPKKKRRKARIADQLQANDNVVKRGGTTSSGASKSKALNAAAEKADDSSLVAMDGGRGSWWRPMKTVQFVETEGTVVQKKARKSKLKRHKSIDDTATGPGTVLEDGLDQQPKKGRGTKRHVQLSLQAPLDIVINRKQSLFSSGAFKPLTSLFEEGSAPRVASTPRPMTVKTESIVEQSQSQTSTGDIEADADFKAPEPKKRRKLKKKALDMPDIMLREGEMGPGYTPIAKKLGKKRG
ncbi:hypothetical protein HK104_003357 [Borealophlyctis nickersoniae]|nr:hypothetical protein HK104_003357 [Borealophlyctis nickersoniae]